MQSVKDIQYTGYLELDTKTTSVDKPVSEADKLISQYSKGSALGEEAKKYALKVNPILKKAADFGCKIVISRAWEDVINARNEITRYDAVAELVTPKGRKFQVGHAQLRVERSMGLGRHVGAGNYTVSNAAEIAAAKDALYKAGRRESVVKVSLLYNTVEGGQNRLDVGDGVQAAQRVRIVDKRGFFEEKQNLDSPDGYTFANKITKSQQAALDAWQGRLLKHQAELAELVKNGTAKLSAVLKEKFKGSRSSPYPDAENIEAIEYEIRCNLGGRVTAIGRVYKDVDRVVKSGTLGAAGTYRVRCGIKARDTTLSL